MKILKEVTIFNKENYPYIENDGEYILSKFYTEDSILNEIGALHMFNNKVIPSNLVDFYSSLYGDSISILMLSRIWENYFKIFAKSTNNLLRSIEENKDILGELETYKISDEFYYLNELLNSSSSLEYEL